MYEIRFTDEALADLRWFQKRARNEILDGIEANLSHEPGVQTRNRKRLRPNDTAEWELRIGKHRVFYDADDTEQKVFIEAIGYKTGSILRFRGEEREL